MGSLLCRPLSGIGGPSGWRVLVLVLVVVVFLAGCSFSGRSSPSQPASAPPLDSTVVPALQTDEPVLRAVPSRQLRDGQTVLVTVTGFGPGSKFRLSACASGPVDPCR